MATELDKIAICSQVQVKRQAFLFRLVIHFLVNQQNESDVCHEALQSLLQKFAIQDFIRWDIQFTYNFYVDKEVYVV